MTPGLSNDILTISDIRKTAVINNELLRFQIDIAGLQETRLTESGCLKESDYTFFWHGKKEEEVREYGFGFAVRNSLLDKVLLDNTGTEHVFSIGVDYGTSVLTLCFPSHLRVHYCYVILVKYA